MLSTDEIKKLLGIMTISYPNYKLVDPQLTADIWKEMFAEYTYPQVASALKSFIATDKSGFAPSIGQLIDKIHSVQEIATEENESTVWQRVMKAICNSNYHATEEFEKLDEISKKVIGSPEQLKRMASDEDFNESVQKSLFMRNYSQIKQMAKEFNRLPSEVRQQIKMQEQLLLKGNADGQTGM